MEKVALQDIQSAARKVIRQLSHKTDGATLIVLSGDLGAGKTTFVQALAHELGITDAVQRPTYVLMKSYPISYKELTRLVHIDAYRLNSPHEFAALKPQSFLEDPHALVCLEWPEKAAGMLPKPDIILRFSSEGASEGERYISIDPE